MEEQTKRGSKKHFYVVNPKSEDGSLAVVWFRRKWTGYSFFMGFQRAFEEIALMRLGSEAKDVFLFILGTVDFHNEVVIPQVEIARKLRMKKQNVSRAIKALVDKRVLLKSELGYKQKRSLKLNPMYAWKGKLKNLGLQPKETPEKKKRKRKSSKKKVSSPKKASSLKVVASSSKAAK